MASLSYRIFRTTQTSSRFLSITTKKSHGCTSFGCNVNYCTSWASHGFFLNHRMAHDNVGQFIRLYGGSSNSTPNEQPEIKEMTRFEKFKKILYKFYLGGKVLFGDVKVTWKIRRKLKSNNNNYSLLSRREQWTMFKTQKNLKKTLPIVLLSCLPVVGYLGPIIGFLRPREFLSHHFWTAKQTIKYQILDDKERSEYEMHILKDVIHQVKQLADERRQDLIHSFINKTAKNQIIPKNDELMKILPSFSSGVLTLENLENGHLRNLCSFWLLSRWLPTSILLKRLRREITEIHKDDDAIIREGIKTLNDKEIDEACHVRGLNTSNLSSEDMIKWLQDWIDLSKQVSETETSFLAHVAVFKTLNS